MPRKRATQPCVTPGCANPLVHPEHPVNRDAIGPLVAREPAWRRRSADPEGTGATMLEGKDLTGWIRAA